MTQEGGRTGPAPDDYWAQEVTMTRAQLQGERDAWYENGLANGGNRERNFWVSVMSRPSQANVVRRAR